MVGGKTLRSWKWSIDLPFTDPGAYTYSLYGVDRYNQKSTVKTGTVTVTRAVRVVVNSQDPAMGSITVTPAIPANGLVEIGTKLKVVAAPKTGYLFRLLEVVVDGVPLDDITPSRVATAEFTVTGNTEITPQLIVNPYPALAGQWSGVFDQSTGSVVSSSSNFMSASKKVTPSAGVGAVTVTVSKTGAFSARITWGRSAFSCSGVFDSAGFAQLIVPASFGMPVKFGGGVAPLMGDGGWGSIGYATLNVDDGLRFECGNAGQGGAVCTQSVGLAKALDLAAIKSYVGTLPRHYNVSMGSGGYMSVDITSLGGVLLSGASCAGAESAKSLRISFNSSAAFTKLETIMDGEGANFYSVASPAGRVVGGALNLTGDTCYGSAGSIQVNTGYLDPVQQFASDDFSVDLVDGSSYVKPANGQAPLPFDLNNRPSFAVSLSGNQIGTLSWANQRPLFKALISPSGPASQFAIKAASLSLNVTTGAFSGTILSSGSINGGGSTSQQNRSFSGVLIQNGGAFGIGVTADGLPVTFQ